MHCYPLMGDIEGSIYSLGSYQPRIVNFIVYQVVDVVQQVNGSLPSKISLQQPKIWEHLLSKHKRL